MNSRASCQTYTLSRCAHIAILIIYLVKQSLYLKGFINFFEIDLNLIFITSDKNEWHLCIFKLYLWFIKSICTVLFCFIANMCGFPILKNGILISITNFLISEIDISKKVDIFRISHIYLVILNPLFF